MYVWVCAALIGILAGNLCFVLQAKGIYANCMQAIFSHSLGESVEPVESLGSWLGQGQADITRRPSVKLSGQWYMQIPAYS